MDLLRLQLAASAIDCGMSKIRAGQVDAGVSLIAKGFACLQGASGGRGSKTEQGGVMASTIALACILIGPLVAAALIHLVQRESRDV